MALPWISGPQGLGRKIARGAGKGAVRIKREQDKEDRERELKRQRNPTERWQRSGRQLLDGGEGKHGRAGGTERQLGTSEIEETSKRLKVIDLAAQQPQPTSKERSRAPVAASHHNDRRGTLRQRVGVVSQGTSLKWQSKDEAVPPSQRDAVLAGGSCKPTRPQSTCEEVPPPRRDAVIAGGSCEPTRPQSKDEAVPPPLDGQAAMMAAQLATVMAWPRRG